MDKPRICGSTLMVPTGGNAVMTVALPGVDPHLEWTLRYGSPEAVRFQAASVVESFDYLLSDNINMTEATRRLRVLRAAVRDRRFWTAAPGVSLADGQTKSLSDADDPPKMVKCPSCRGSCVEGIEQDVCPVCDGQGLVPESDAC